MTAASTHQFVAEVRDGHDHLIGQAPMEVDWLPGLEYAWFTAVRAGRAEATTTTPVGRIEPIWDRSAGRPYVGGALVTLTGGAARGFTVQLPGTYLRAAAVAAAATLAGDDRDANDNDNRNDDKNDTRDDLTWRVIASEAGAEAPGDDRNDDGFDLDVEEVGVSLPLRRTCSRDLLEAATAIGPLDEEDPPVLLSRDVLRTVNGLVQAAGAVEIGGVLLGYLHRDPGEPGAILTEVTAQVPLSRAEGGAASLRFTPEVWADLETARRGRDEDELVLGWWHSHPDWCRDCPESRRRECALNGIFFSRQDQALHRAVFGRAYQVALLLSVRGETIVPTLFGWRHGLIVPRAFHLATAPTAPTLENGEQDRDTEDA